VSATTRLILWRHGVTDWNEQGIFQGRADIPLNERGLAQAAAVAPLLAAMRPDVLYVSPLSRARQTAQAFVDLTGAAMHIDDRLTEIDVGSWVGISLAKVAALDPAAGADMAAGRDYRRSPTGETMTEVGRRVGECLRELADNHDGETVLVVSHGGAIRTGIANLLELPYAVSIKFGGMVNCAWSGVARRSGIWRLEAYNHTPPAFDPKVRLEI